MNLEILEKYINENLIGKSINIFIKKDDFSMNKYDGFHYNGNTIVESCSINEYKAYNFLRILFYSDFHFDIKDTLNVDDIKFVINNLK